ncbi:MAG: 2Fe-2S iron-sulfur cluster binding domain-containing protein [Anaerohalosphaera sp.]|nr:2Fe-2S iron-sulfur cluster binding domain-containing protein [Anaerohalosphaera sp.]
MDYILAGINIEMYFWAILTFAGLVIVLAVWLMVSAQFLVNYGVCKLDINSGEKPLDVEGGQTLLSCLYANDIFIPSACGGKGSCGHCKLVVTEGGGPILPTETPFLTRQEIRSKVRLACQVKVREDVYVRIPSDLLDVKMFTGVVEHSRVLTHDIKEVRFKIDDDTISQRPGQYIQIQAPSPDGPVFRAYSISSPTYDETAVELMVRLVPGGIGSTYIHELDEGDPVSFTGPYGEFYLNEEPETEIICVGGGCGLAPMKNIIYSIYDKWPERSCWLFFGCRTTEDVFYLKEFQKLAKKHPALKIKYALSDPLKDGEEWDGETGFVHLAVDKYLEPDVARQAFLCGPPLMIDAVTRILEAKGIASDDIFYDKF